jgi:zinc protease
MRRTILLLLLLLVPASAAQTIRFEKYRLPNGMTVILHEDHSLPIVAVNTWFRVGSKDEPPGRSGFAHLFEHLMFMGTRRVPGNQFDIIMETGGGSNNATTSFDRTNYFSWGPASLLPTLLWLDADRLEDLARTMTQEKLDRQRDVVRNERRQSVENVPYGKAELLLTGIMFPPGHPYHDEVIGRHEDLEAAQVQDVIDFFATFYVPNNATLCVAGDFDPAKVKPLIADLFGTLPRGTAPPHRFADPVTLGRVVRATTVDQVQLPRITFAWHSAPFLTEGDAELDLLAAILSQGKSSRLYRRLILDEKLASDVSAAQSSAMLQSVFRIDVIASPEADLDRIEAVVDEEVARLLRDGVSADELARRKGPIELAKASQLQSLLTRADLLNAYEFYWGDPDGFERDLNRYREASPESVLHWARRTLTRDSRAIVRVLPQDPPRAGSPRDARPADLAATAFSPSPPLSMVLSNGVRVLLWQRPQAPVVSLRVHFTPGGPIDSPATPGISTLAARMLTEGAGTYTAEQFSDAVQAAGASISVHADYESASADMTVIARNFARAADLLRLALREAAFRPEDWERVRRLHLDELRRQDDEPTIVASRVAQRLLFGDRSPFAFPLAGTKAGVEALDLGAVRAHSAWLFSPAHATILVAGDVTPEQVRAALEPLAANWTPASPPRASAPQPVEPVRSGTLRVALVHRPGAVQTVIRFMAPGIRAADPARVPYHALGTILGGTFTSRLNANLREDKGYTYGARASFRMFPSTGYFIASSSVRADVTGASLREFLREFSRLRAGDVSGEELAKARESIRTDVIQAFERNDELVATGAKLIEAGLPWESLAQDLLALGSLGADDLNARAREALPIAQGVLVLVGDRDVILPQLGDLDLPEPVEYTVEGVRVSE